MSGPIFRTRVWKDVYEAGHASRVCDEIVRNRPAPRALLDALELAPLVPEEHLRPGVTAKNRVSRAPEDHDLAALIAEGLNNDQIAETLGTSVHVVKNAVVRLLATLGARNRTHAAVLAIRTGLIE